MSGRRGVHAATVLLGASLLGAGALETAAHAAAWDAYGNLTAAGGYTDNALTVPEPRAGEPNVGPEADSFAEMRPELFLVTQAPRTRIDASYAFQTQVYQSHEQANSYTNEARISWLRLISPQTDLRFLFEGMQGERSAFQQGGLIVGQVPATRLRTVEARLEQSVEHHFASPWTLRQALSGAILRPFGANSELQPTSEVAELRLEVFKESVNARWGGELISTYALIGASRMGDVVLQPESRFLINIALLTHQRALTEQLQLELGVGALQIADGEDPSIAIYEPSGRLGLSYTTASEETLLGIGYDHGAGASTYTGDVSLIDSVSAYVRKEILPDQEMVFDAEGTYSFARNFSVLERAVGDRADIVQVNARLVWRVEESLALGLVFAGQRQTPRDSGATMSSVQDLRRNSVMLTVTGTVGATQRRRASSGENDRTGEQRRDLLDGASSEGGDGNR